MNVTCTGCPAKYAVPDEKIRGKKVRITCKHCATNIVVDGTALSAEPSAAPQATESAKPAATPAAALPDKAAGESSYIVGFSDDRQETLALSEIVALYAIGKLDDDTLVWKDGMPDWLAPFDVPEIATAMFKRGVSRRVTAFSVAGAMDNEPTVIARSPLDEINAESPAKHLDFGLPPRPAAELRQSTPELKLPSATAAKPAATVAKPASSAARRAEQRGAVDLFGGVADAGSETDASLELGSPADDGHKLTGARNESSVLFSLDALTKPDPKTAKARAKEQEKEANVLFGDSAPNSLLNLGGGGLSALAAPDFSQPYVAPVEAQVRPSDPVEVPNSAAEKKKGAGVWVVALLGIAAAAGVAFFVTQKRGMEKPAAPAQETAAAAPPVQTSTAEPSAPLPSAEAPATSAEAPAPAELAAQAITAAGAKPSATAAVGAAAAPAAVSKPVATPDAKKTEAMSPASAATPAPAPAPAADGAAFDKSAAVAALGAAAASAGSCKKPDGPTGSGKVSVTFAPSGRATMTNVGGAFAGTEVGGCVARLFRAAKVPAFSGDPVTVSKSFSIE
ncbi:MAG: zinc-ribbon domain-containing protein, partial [Pseudomonadota bacterium]